MIEELRHRDLRHLWHPCTPINAFEQAPFPVIERAEGVRLFEVGGRPILDGISSWWCVNLGHGHPRIVEAIQWQAGILQHSILGGMSHPGAIELAERLAAVAPEGLNHCFFASDGASAVEAALKIAVQYWANAGVSGRTRFIALQDGYHGDTLGAIGVGYVESFHKDFKEVVCPAFRAVSPHCAQCPCGKKPETCDIECFEWMRELVEAHHRETAAVIIEPLCQGAAGIRIYPEEYLQRLRALCDRHGLLLIADEIAVGFGRTGSMFACERARIQPDIMTVGKGMTGGYLPMSAALVRDAVHDAFRETPDRDRTFYHSHTFGGNPIACAAALAALDVYRDESVIERSQPRIRQLAKGMRKLGDTLGESKWRALGMIGVVEIDNGSGGAERARRIGRRALELGLFIRPLGRAVYLWPPLTTSADELEEMLSILKTSVAQTFWTGNGDS